MPYLEFLEGFNQGAVFPLNGKITVGRASSNSLCLPDGRVSRQHAVLTPRGGVGYMVTDIGSANGTLVNDGRLKPNVSCPLRGGDTLRIGVTTMAFHEEGKPGTGGAKPAEKVPFGLIQAPEAASFSVVLSSAKGDEPMVRSAIAVSEETAASLRAEKKTPAELYGVINRLQKLIDISGCFGSLYRQQELFDKILDNIFDIFPQAEKAVILLPDAAKKELHPALWRDRLESQGTAYEVKISRTIVQRVAEKHQAVLSTDAQKDFSGAMSVIAMSTRSMMCAPFLYHGELLGIIYVDTTSGQFSFTADDLAMLTGIVSQAAIAIKNSHLRSAVEKEAAERLHLARYLPNDVVEGVMSGRVPLELGGKLVTGTVFFADLIGFTPMTEALPPDEVIERLNQFYHKSTEVITRNRGTLHKFAGDMVMAFWNVMFPDENHAANAVCAGLQLQAAMWLLNIEHEQRHKPAVHLGIGCNTGSFAAGNIGSHEHMEYTVIGDSVNLAQRIESKAGQWQVYVSEATYAEIADSCLAVRLPPANLPGKREPVEILSIRGFRQSDDRFLLNLPVRLADATGNEVGDGLLTMYAGKEPQMFLQLVTDVEITAGADFSMTLRVPEIVSPYVLVGRAVTVCPSSNPDEVRFFQVVVGDLRLPEEAQALLGPGVCVESAATWDEELKRH